MLAESAVAAGLYSCAGDFRNVDGCLVEYVVDKVCYASVSVGCFDALAAVGIESVSADWYIFTDLFGVWVTTDVVSVDDDWLPHARSGVGSIESVLVRSSELSTVGCSAVARTGGVEHFGPDMLFGVLVLEHNIVTDLTVV